MKVNLSERTAQALLGLADWEEYVMNRFNKLEQEAQETRASMDNVKAGVAAYVTKNDAAIANLKQQLADLDVISDDQVAQLTSELDAVQQEGADLVASLTPADQPPTEPAPTVNPTQNG